MQSMLGKIAQMQLEQAEMNRLVKFKLNELLKRAKKGREEKRTLN